MLGSVTVNNNFHNKWSCGLTDFTNIRLDEVQIFHVVPHFSGHKSCMHSIYVKCRNLYL